MVLEAEDCDSSRQQVHVVKALFENDFSLLSSVPLIIGVDDDHPVRFVFVLVEPAEFMVLLDGHCWAVQRIFDVPLKIVFGLSHVEEDNLWCAIFSLGQRVQVLALSHAQRRGLLICLRVVLSP